MTFGEAHSRSCIPLPEGRIVGGEFFARESDLVAPELIGKVLWRVGVGGGRVTEVEAYLPSGDGASHSAPGRTRRNAPMFGPAGRLYVFLSYGVHSLLNIVCDAEGSGSAILIRSYEPMEVTGVDGIHKRTVGPGRVGSALAVSVEMSGLPLGEDSGVFVLDDGMRPRVGKSARIGISRSEELMLRYYMLGSSHVSAPRREIGGQRG